MSLYNLYQTMVQFVTNGVSLEAFWSSGGLLFLSIICTYLIYWGAKNDKAYFNMSGILPELKRLKRKKESQNEGIVDSKPSAKTWDVVNRAIKLLEEKESPKIKLSTESVAKPHKNGFKLNGVNEFITNHTIDSCLDLFPVEFKDGVGNFTKEPFEVFFKSMSPVDKPYGLDLTKYPGYTSKGHGQFQINGGGLFEAGYIRKDSIIPFPVGGHYFRVKWLDGYEGKNFELLEKIPGFSGRVVESNHTEPVKLESFFDKLPENETIEVTNLYISGELIGNNARAEFTTKNGEKFTCNYTRPTTGNWTFQNGNYYKGCKKDGKFVLTEMLTGWSEDKPYARTVEKKEINPSVGQIIKVKFGNPCGVDRAPMGLQKDEVWGGIEFTLVDGTQKSRIPYIRKASNEIIIKDKCFTARWEEDVNGTKYIHIIDRIEESEFKINRVENKKSIDPNIIPGTFEVKLIDKTTSPYTFETRNGSRIQRRWNNKKFLSIETGDIIQVCDDMLSVFGDGHYIFNVLAVFKDWSKPEMVTRNIKDLKGYSHYFVKLKEHGNNRWYVAEKSSIEEEFWIANRGPAFKPNQLSEIIGPISPEEVLASGIKEFKLEEMT